MADYKQQFLDLYQQNIHRDGASDLLLWLESKTDFFSAPASTRFHCACEGGLVQHSVSVCNVLLQKHFDPDKDNLESFTLCALLHDLCKAQYYKVSERNVKNANGQWEKQPYYAVDDQFPYGHGEKSVFLIERFVRLKTAEAMAIRWHMGGFDDSAKAGSFALSHAFEKYPLAVKLHLADLESTYICEHHTSAVR